MKLTDYLSLRRISRQDFALQIGVSEVSVTRYANGVRHPRPAHMARILVATNGAVMPNDFLPVSSPQPAPQPHDAEAAE